MTIQSIENETIIRIPNSVNYSFLQDFIDYLQVKSILSNSQATDNEIDSISEKAQTDWWEINKNKFL